MVSDQPSIDVWVSKALLEMGPANPSIMFDGQRVRIAVKNATVIYEKVVDDDERIGCRLIEAKFTPPPEDVLRAHRRLFPPAPASPTP